MTRFALAVRIVLIAAGVFILVNPAAEAANHGWSPQDLESQLMCPTCHVPLDQSDSQAAQDIRSFVQQRHDAGWSEQRTKQALIDRFGTRILAAPPFQGFDMLAWLVPSLLLLGGAGIVLGLAWQWSHRRGATAIGGEPSAPDPALAARIDADMERLD